MTHAPKIRVELTGPTAANAKVFYVAADGAETEISHCVTGIDIHADVNKPTTATLHTIFVEGHVTADLTRVVTKHLKPGQSWECA